MTCVYNEDYFQRGTCLGISNYVCYSWRPEHTFPLAFRFIELLNLSREDTLLDHGSAHGYLVYALRLLYRQAYGCDISSYAIAHAPKEIEEYMYLLASDATSIPRPATIQKYTWCTSRDVLEHISYDVLPSILSLLYDACENLCIIVPLAKHGKYVIPYAEMDTTHIIREDTAWWLSQCEKAGFSLQRYSHYEHGIKETWKDYEEGYLYAFFSS